MKTTAKNGVGISSFLVFLAALFPNIVSAQIQITEILYDVPGADQGREWVELTNTGSEISDIGKYKLLENNTNHGLKLVSGVVALAPGQSAIIASDAQKFLADYPNFSGTLFDSAFALSNTGEAIAIKDASSTVLTEAAYTAVDDANGTGGSLQLKDGTFVAALATPGVFPGELMPVPKAPVKEKVATKAKGVAAQKTASVQGNTARAAAASDYSSKEQSGAVSLFSTIPPFIFWTLCFAAVIFIGAAGVFFMASNKPETNTAADEFNIE
jgi:hypothetical protein